MKRCFHRRDARHPGGDREPVDQKPRNHCPPRAPEADGPGNGSCRILQDFTQFGNHRVICDVTSGTAAGLKVMVSVRTLLHSRSAKPLDSKKNRMRALSHPRTSSRTGTSTLNASSPITVRRAIWV